MLGSNAWVRSTNLRVFRIELYTAHSPNSRAGGKDAGNALDAPAVPRGTGRGAPESSTGWRLEACAVTRPAAKHAVAVAASMRTSERRLVGHDRHAGA